MLTVSQVKPTLPLNQHNPVRVLRLSHHLLITDVAKATGLPRQAIENVERGHKPSLRTALVLARFYETSIDELFAYLVGGDE